MRYGMLSQWYDPEPGPAALPGVLARGLVGRGHAVNVVTGFPNYPSGQIAQGYQQCLFRDEVLDDVGVRRVALYPSHDSSAVRRVLNYGSFGVSAAISGTAFVRGADAVWVNYSPITVALPMWVARLRDRVPLVVHVGDLWPDTMTAAGFTPSGFTGAALEKVLHEWTDAMYRSAAVVTYISPGVRDILIDRGVPEHKLRYAPMWADETLFSPASQATRTAAEAWRRSNGVGDQDILVLYAGALGHAQGLETLLRAVATANAELADTGARRRLRCIIAGSGTAEEELRSLARDLRIPGDNQPITFIGRVAPELMPTLMAAADACYIGLRRDPLSKVTMPSKTQAIMASGRAIVAAADGDIKDVVTSAGAGYATNSGDQPGLTRILLRLCESGRASLESVGLAGLRHYRSEYAVEHAVTRAEQALTYAAGGERTP
ncbi:putative glycosyl transferase [Dermatophilus congolensis]|uniref:D-inositol 3-phosphate glycosyltransferase n=1 Tax=Dermatophilus congolensis TaxID=1863 RepID=A0AA46BP12_9MICO|nr:glycosyltransferase family 4 protein [Dermatophilus congolensis]STD11498.1 putative glycosyl transferase [Dermatophilus congolensis]